MKLHRADILFSQFIRERDFWTCQRCNKYYEPPTQALHCSHFISRGNYATRFDPENCIALCHGCHRYWDTKNKAEYEQFKKDQLGDKFDLLIQRKNQKGIPKSQWLEYVNKLIKEYKNT